MPKTTADQWFEDYLREQGIEPGEHEPDLSALGVEGVQPDFLPTGEAGQLACEVKQFGKDSKLGRRLAEQTGGTIPERELLDPIRRQVKAAARQLKPLAERGIPLAVVLANPEEGARVDLSLENVIAALYGNLRWTMSIDLNSGEAVGEGRLEVGRDGELTNNHGYISAVVLLRRRELELDVREEISASVRKRYDGEPRNAEERLERAMAAIEELGRHELPTGHYFHVDVIETLSAAATPLPKMWFSGERDRRWRCNDKGCYELVDASSTSAEHWPPRERLGNETPSTKAFR